MGLRCLLGHDYGDTRTERDREERGDELVVTVTEIEECTRCGDTRVVSENTEVTSLGHASGSEPAEPAGADRSADATGGDPSPPDPADAAPPEDVEVVIDEAESDTGGFDGPAASTGDQTVETDRLTTDDAEILGDEPAESTESEPQRGPGEWPDSDATHPADASDGEATPTPEEAQATADRDKPAGEQTADAAEIVDADGASGEDGEIVDADAAPGEDGEIVDADAAPGEDGDIVDADGAPGEEPVVDDAEIVEGPGGEDAEIVDETHTAESPAAREARSDIVDDVADDPPTPTDDAEIVDGDAGDWPSHEDDDEGYDAQPGDTGADVSVDGMQPSVDPETLVDENSEFVGSEPAATGPETNGTAPGGEATGVDLSTTHDDPAGEYFCPDCGHAEPIGGTSLRKGDICPECMRGYIDERPAE